MSSSQTLFKYPKNLFTPNYTYLCFCLWVNYYLHYIPLFKLFTFWFVCHHFRGAGQCPHLFTISGDQCHFSTYSPAPNYMPSPFSYLLWQNIVLLHVLLRVTCTAHLYTCCSLLVCLHAFLGCLVVVQLCAVCCVLYAVPFHRYSPCRWRCWNKHRLLKYLV